MWMCAPESSAISAAFSPPHVPARSLGGLSPVGSQGPNASAAAAIANAALGSIAPPQLHSIPLLIHGAVKGVSTTRDGNRSASEPSTVSVLSTLVTVTLPESADSTLFGPVTYHAPAPTLRVTLKVWLAI